MTLTFPRAMPEVGAMQHGFEPQRVDYLSPETGARSGSVSAGWPLWHLTVSLNNMRTRQADIWRAWLPSQRGSARLFYGRDLSRDIPRWHAEKGRPFGTPTGWTQTIDDGGNAVLALTGAPALLVLSLGDYIGFVWGDTKRSLVRIVEGGRTDGSGNVTVTVEPPVHAVTPGNATINLYKPTCLMRLVTANTKLGDQIHGGKFTAAGGTIEAIQDLIP